MQDTWYGLFTDKKMRWNNSIVGATDDVVAALRYSGLEPADCKLIFTEINDGGLERFDLADPQFTGMSWMEVLAWLFKKFYNSDGAVYAVFIKKSGADEIAELIWEMDN